LLKHNYSNARMHFLFFFLRVYEIDINCFLKVFYLQIY